MAPYATGTAIPPSARLVGSGMLTFDGARALVPLAFVTRSSALWVRNGLGQTSSATIERRVPASGIAVLRLSHPLRSSPGTEWAPHDAFPGSPGFAVDYVVATNNAPAWPWLVAGFVGPTAGTRRELGIELPPGTYGGPVFDDRGRVVGTALAKGGANLLVPASELRALFPEGAGATTIGRARSRLSVDEVYETALLLTLQVIADRAGAR
jgi:hypothetical protein